jgi:hypothetical protein
MSTVRRAGTASAAILSGLTLMLGIVHMSAPEWIAVAGLDVWSFPNDRAALRAARNESSRLRDDAEELRSSIEAAECIIAELVVGSLSLAEATDLIEPLMRNRSGFPSGGIYADVPTFRRAVARYLIDRVRRVLQDNPSELACILPRLEAAYHAIE